MTTHSPSAHAEERGFITIAIVIVLMAVGLSTALTVVLSAVGGAETEAVRTEGLRASWLAHACAERARTQLGVSASYSGDETLTLTGGTCEVMPLNSLASGAYEVRAWGRAGQAFSRVLVTFQVEVDASGSEVTQTSWSRVADF